MKDYLGGARFGEALTDELLVVAYDYNSQEPRFFSKFFAKADPFIYDVPMSEATGASSAAPTFFDPKVSTNKLGLTELQIDGGIICNNPALYAYQMAKILNKKKDIRLLSLGTGEKTFTPYESADDLTLFSYIKKMGEFMMNMDAYASDFYLLNEFTENGTPEKYLRMQTTSNVGMDKIDDANIA